MQPCQHVKMSTCKHDNMQTFHITINTTWLACLPLVSTAVAKILKALAGFFPTSSFNLSRTLSQEIASQPAYQFPSLSPSLSGLSCLGHRNSSEGQTFGEEFSHKSSLFQGSECKNSTFPKIPRHRGSRAPRITGFHQNSRFSALRVLRF